jgi:hypothetical protein
MKIIALIARVHFIGRMLILYGIGRVDYAWNGSLSV